MAPKGADLHFVPGHPIRFLPEYVLRRRLTTRLGTSSGVQIAKRPSQDHLDATQRAFLDACVRRGHRRVEDHNAPGAIGVGPFPSTGLGGIRRSTAGMYLHPARGRPNLTLRDRVTVERVVLRGDRAVGVQLAESGEIVDSHQIILAAA